jgi:hypothetical protein
MAQDGLVLITKEDAELALEGIKAYISDNDTGTPESYEELAPYRKALHTIGMSAGNWEPIDSLHVIVSAAQTVIELKSGSDNLLAVPASLNGKSQLAYLSVVEAGIEWVDFEDVEGWRYYEGQS